MAHRLATGGRRIDRTRRLTFTFDGRPHEGLAGDTLASALMASGRLLMGRSFKYHRPRGPVAASHEEPNALVGLGRGARFEPNQRATVAPLHDGLTALSQNRWPSLETDLGVVNSALSRFLPAGFYYKTFLWPRAFWKHVYEPFIRQSAGLGRPPEGADADRYEHVHLHADLLVAGGGIVGLQAALMAGRAGKRVVVFEQDGLWGGRAPRDGDVIDGRAAADWVEAAVAELAAMPDVTLRLNTVAAGLYDHGWLLGWESVTDAAPGTDAPRQRLWKVRAAHTIIATGAIERPLAFAGNDVPGVMLAGAVRDFVTEWGVSPGRRVVVVTNNDDAYRTALTLHAAGVDVPAILDARTGAESDLPAAARAAGIEVRTGTGIAKVVGDRAVTGVTVCDVAGDGGDATRIACDAVAMSGGWSPVPHLWSHSGGKLIWDADNVAFAPDPDRPPTGADGAGMATAVGAASGAMRGDAAMAQAARAAGAHLGVGAEAPAVAVADEAPMRAVWIMPERAGPDLRAKMFLDFQNDVKVSDVQLAAREGFVSVEHAKRYTTLGMASDQGKLSNINGLAVLADAQGKPIPEVGTTTFRPPYVPVTLGAIAGEARGETFQPTRRTALDDWHAGHGAVWEPVGQWRRPYAFLRDGEATAQAVTREVRAVREAVGLLDASTLGKIVVAGPDAGRFLDRIYTNMMSTLKVGRCRYGLMCSENGFVMDDGVVARLSDDQFLCHTTSGGADRVHAHLEEWLQTEWWDLQVFTANVTEQWSQIAVAGPRARQLLERLDGLDLSAEALPFMGWTEGRIADIPARVFRISFSGELSFEIAVPAARGRDLWDRLLDEGAALGAVPYGTEALHVLRAEKGFIMIGDETDGTVIPQDLNMDWVISKKKDDFIGKRAQMRDHMTDPDRWRLVGLRTLSGARLPDGAYAVGQGRNANGQRVTEGRVTSSYMSPTLGHGIAMGLVRRGPERMGEVLDIPTTDGRVLQAEIVSPVFYDPEGARQNV